MSFYCILLVLNTFKHKLENYKYRHNTDMELLWTNVDIFYCVSTDMISICRHFANTYLLFSLPKFDTKPTFRTLFLPQLPSFRLSMHNFSSSKLVKTLQWPLMQPHQVLVLILPLMLPLICQITKIFFTDVSRLSDIHFVSITDGRLCSVAGEGMVQAFSHLPFDKVLYISNFQLIYFPLVPLPRPCSAM